MAGWMNASTWRAYRVHTLSRTQAVWRTKAETTIEEETGRGTTRTTDRATTTLTVSLYRLERVFFGISHAVRLSPFNSAAFRFPAVISFTNIFAS